MSAAMFTNTVIKLQDLRRQAMKRDVLREIKAWDEINVHSLIYNYFKSSLHSALANNDNDVNSYLKCVANNILSEQNYSTLKVYPDDVELARCIDNFSSSGKKVIESYCRAILEDNMTITKHTNIVAAKLYARILFAALFFKWVDNAGTYAKQIKKFNKAMGCFRINITADTDAIYPVDLTIRDMESIEDVAIFVKYINQITQS